jgi:hypothetical protein
MKKLIVTFGLAWMLVLGSQMPAKAGWVVFVAPVPMPVAPPPYYPAVAVYPTAAWCGPGFYPAGYYWGANGYHYYAHPYWNRAYWYHGHYCWR